MLSATSGNEALALVAKDGLRPDLVISDYNLPGRMNGVESIEALRAALSWKIPGIVLTGDIRSHVTESIAKHGLAVAPSLSTQMNFCSSSGSVPPRVRRTADVKPQRTHQSK